MNNRTLAIESTANTAPPALQTSDAGGDCLRSYGAQHVTWWYFTAHDCGGTGAAFFGGQEPTEHNDFNGTIWDVGQNLARDPHLEKGTGLHCVNLDDNNIYAFEHNRFAFYCHDISSGAAIDLSERINLPQSFMLLIECDQFMRRCRPVWIVDAGPQGGTTAYVNTWQLGKLAPGKTRNFVWHVTPILAGTHTLKYRVAAGLNGKAKAKVNGQDDFQGTFTVAVSGKPAQSRVNPNTGQVIRSGQSSSR